MLTKLKTLYIASASSELESSSSDAIYLIKYLSKKYKIKNIRPKQSLTLKNSVILFVDRHHYFSVFEDLDSSNTIITTWWHGWKGTKANINRNLLRYYLSKFGLQTKVAKTWFTVDNYYADLLAKLPKGMIKAYKVICSCNEVIERLVKYHNIPREKIVKIPIGVDLDIFQPVKDEREKEKIKAKLGVPKDKFIIGNFSRDTQMDGTPKWVKDPESLIKVIKNIYQKHPNIYILLTNQRRDFVKHYLKKFKIPYKHIIEKKHNKLPDIYKITDLSLITSR